MSSQSLGSRGWYSKASIGRMTNADAVPTPNPHHFSQLDCPSAIFGCRYGTRQCRVGTFTPAAKAQKRHPTGKCTVMERCRLLSS